MTHRQYRWHSLPKSEYTKSFLAWCSNGRLSQIQRPQQSSQHVVLIVPIERRLDCGWLTTVQKKADTIMIGMGNNHSQFTMAIGRGETNRYIVINPGTRSFESRNPGALFVTPTRVKTAGSDTEDPDFAWHPDILVNEDRLCHQVTSQRTRARSDEIIRINGICQATKQRYASLQRISNFNILEVALSWIGCLTPQLTIFQSYMWRHIDVKADWRRSWIYGRAPNAMDIS